MSNNNINLFNASREMSSRVAEYMRVYVWGVALRTRANKVIKLHNDGIKATEALGKAMSEDDKIKTIEKHTNIIIAEREKLNKQIKEEATFKFIEADNELFKKYLEGKLSEGICAWFEGFNLSVSGTKFESMFVDALSGRKMASARKIVNSNAMNWTDKRAKEDILKTFYSLLSEEMLKAGTLKPAAIPEDVREHYAPKKKA